MVIHTTQNPLTASARMEMIDMKPQTKAGWRLPHPLSYQDRIVASSGCGSFDEIASTHSFSVSGETMACSISGTFSDQLDDTEDDSLAAWDSFCMES